MQFFLRARHWMLFIFLVLPILMQYGPQIYFQTKFQSFVQELEAAQGDITLTLNRSQIMDYAWIYFAAVAAYLVSDVVKIGWRYTVGMRMYRDRPVGTSMNAGVFTAANIAQAIITLGFVLFALFIFDDLVQFALDMVNENTPQWAEDMEEKDFVAMFVTAVATFFFGGIIYLVAAIIVCIFTAKGLRSVEMNRPMRGSDIFGYVVLLLLPYIGVWILQPKVNRYVETGNMAKEEDLGADIWG